MSQLSITRSNTNGHAAFLYNTLDERFEVLAQYFKEGIANGELCVFATNDKPETVVDKFSQLGFDASKSIESGQLRIYDMNETYLPDGQFDENRMLDNFKSFISHADSSEHKGLRIAGEAAWVYEHPEFAEQAHSYEIRANEIIEQSPHVLALCLYPVKDHFAEVMHDTSAAHPAFIYNGEPTPNLHYIVS